MQIIVEEWGSNLCVYLYDADGSPIGMQYRSTGMAENTFGTFWFEKNLQGDIVAVYNMSGVKIRAYAYDAWGNVKETVYTSSGMNYYAAFNPFRYRGYYMDSETELYYLQSRYYDPATGRFLNADGQLNDGLLGYNMFVYCNNNPVMLVDPTGDFPWLIALIVLAVVTISATSCTGYNYEPTHIDINISETYDNYQSAVDAACQQVYDNGISHQGEMDRGKNYAEYGFEYGIDIYYNSDDGMYYLTNAFTSNSIGYVKGRMLLTKDPKYEMFGRVHYHPDIGDRGITFSGEDRDTGKVNHIAIHVIAADGQCNSSYIYMAGWKWDIAQGGK